MSKKNDLKNNKLGFPKSQDEFVRVSNAVPQITKIQSKFRQNNACTRMQQVAEVRKEEIKTLRQAQLANPEKTVLKEFVTQLKAKKLTPEAFFRVADNAYARRISNEKFQETVKAQGLVLLSTQIQRLLYIFNENMEGDITYQEYQHALEAYEMSGENHFVGMGPAGKGYAKLESIVMERLVDLMKTRKITASELFNSIDEDHSDQISLQELRKTIRSLKQSLMEKDLEQIQKFFSMMDADKSGMISRTEFLQHFERAQTIAMEKKAKDAQAAASGDDFAEDDIEQADQGMFTDFVGGVKDFFGGKKKQTFSKLDNVIPGYTLMSPRSKCDNAVSALIKEMKKHNIRASQVFSMSVGRTGGSSTVAKLRDAFVKLAPKINSNLIRDALMSFGEDKTSVSESTFTTTLDAKFDKEVSAGVPNSKNNPAVKKKVPAPTPIGLPRPQTAHPIIKIDSNSSNTLIRKLDNALLRQKLSPFQAFQEADINGDKVITVDELRTSLKKLLPDHELTPADIKMTMLAFDTNRNGRIDEQEFISCITKARESGPVAEPESAAQTPQRQAEQRTAPFDMTQTISAISDDKDQISEMDALVLKVIFHNANLKASAMAQLSENNLILLDLYWSKEDVEIDRTDFIQQYAKTSRTMTEQQAIKLWQALNDNFSETVQKGLDAMYESLRMSNTVVTPAAMKKVMALKLDRKGMASEISVKKLFAEIHQKNTELHLKFQALYEEITGEDCSLTAFWKMFGQFKLLKTLLVSADSLREQQAGVNGLIAQTSIWLEDADTLYDDDENEDNWQDVFTKYLAILYDAMAPQKTAKEIHASLASQSKMLKKVSLRKWIGFLDSNQLRAVSDQNQRCLYMARQVRTQLNPEMDSIHPLRDVLQHIEDKVDKQRNLTSTARATSPIKSAIKSSAGGHNSGSNSNEVSFAGKIEPKAAAKKKPVINVKKLSAAKTTATGYKSHRQTESFVILEETMGCPIQDILLQYTDQQIIPALQFLKDCKRKSAAVTKDMVQAVLKAAEAKLDKKDSSFKVVDIVNHIIQTEDEEIELVKTALKSLQESIDVPIRETLQSMLMGWQDGITKDEFLDSFSKLRKPINMWSLVCLFYYFDVEDIADEVIQLETIVKILSKLKGVPYTRPGSAAAAAPKSNAAKEATSKAIEVAKKAGQFVIAQSQGFLLGFTKVQESILNGNKFPMEKRNVNEVTYGRQNTIEIDDLGVDTPTVLKVVNSLYQLQKVIIDPVNVKKTIFKLRDWFNTFEGDEEDGANAYLQKQIIQAMASHKDNATLTEANILFYRYGFASIRKPNGEALFSLFEILILAFSVIERDGFHQLEVDAEFTKKLFQIAEDEDDDLMLIVAEAVDRLEKRVHLATLILVEEKRIQSKNTNSHLNICDDETWTRCRFSRIVQLIGEKISEPAKLKMFLNKFNQAYDKQLTYYEFYQLFLNELGVTGVTEWMFEDFVSALDELGMAFVELNEVAKWLKRFDIDLGVKIVEVDKSDILNKKMKISPVEYQLSDDDYFRGVPTILNSEVAALTKAIEISNQLDNEGEDIFFDKDFGPQDEDDLTGSANSMYCNGEKPTGHTDPANAEWLRPSEYLDAGQEAHFVKGSASANEVKQGALGDCWFIGALSVLATRDELLRGQAEHIPVEFAHLIDAEAAGMLSSGVYPPIFHKFRSQGIYVIRFFKDTKWRYVIIDDRLPVYKGNKQLVFGKCASADELWVPLIEKAYAKLHGCYQTLISGFIDDGLADMTALVCEKKQLHNKAGEFDDKTKEQFWEFLNTMKDNGCLMGCSVTGGTEKSIRIDGVDTGIMSGHAYSLNDVFEIENLEREEERKSHRLLRIRNPWGRGEWKGKWSDDSEEIDKFEDKLNEYIQELAEDEQFEIGANDGTFLINYASFRDIYNRLFVVNDFPNEWSAIRFSTEWNATCSGGLPIEKTPEANKRFAKNPQFVFWAEDDCEVFISLQQSDGREVQNNKYSKYPFQDRIVSTMLFLFELPDGQDRLSQYGTPFEKATPKVLHEISMRVHLKAKKRYVIVPSPRKAGTLGKFNLSVYTSLLQHEYDVVRIDDPQCRYKFILEEYEKNERRVPAWKIKWCQENLRYMIGKDDNNAHLSRSGLNKSKVAKKKSIRKMGTKKMAQMKQLVSTIKDVGDDDDCNLE